MNGKRKVLTGMGFGDGEVGDALVRAHQKVDWMECAINEPGLGLLHMNHSIGSLCIRRGIGETGN